MATKHFSKKWKGIIRKNLSDAKQKIEQEEIPRFLMKEFGAKLEKVSLAQQ